MWPTNLWLASLPLQQAPKRHQRKIATPQRELKDITNSEDERMVLKNTSVTDQLSAKERPMSSDRKRACNTSGDGPAQSEQPWLDNPDLNSSDDRNTAISNLYKVVNDVRLLSQTYKSRIPPQLATRLPPLSQTGDIRPQRRKLWPRPQKETREGRGQRGRGRQCN